MNISRPQIFQNRHVLREASGQVNPGGSVLLHCAIPCFWDGTFDLQSLTFTWTDLRTGSPVADWRKLIREGKNATSAMTWAKGEILKIEAPEGKIERCNNAQAPYRMGTWRVGFPPLTVDLSAYGTLDSFAVSNIKSQALVKFLAKVDKAQHEFSGLIFLGELRETLRMLHFPFKALNNGIVDHFLKLKKLSTVTRGFETFRRIAAESWLEVAFGWKPLINDIKDLLSAIDRISATPVKEKLSASFVSEVKNAPFGAGYGYGKEPYFLTTGSDKITLQVRYYGALNLASLPVNREKVKSLLGFDLSQVPSAIWELTPWSFLIDYFVGIGDFIQAATTRTSVLSWWAKSERYVRDINLSVVEDVRSNQQIQGLWYNWFKPGSFHVRHVSGRRDPMPSLAPGIQFRLPGLTSLKWLNILALTQAHDSLRSHIERRYHR